MKLLYCGYNGFNQANDTELGNAVTKPTVIFENECDDSDVELYLGWSFFIILTGDSSVLQGFRSDHFRAGCDLTADGVIRKITCTDDLIVGIDSRGRLKKLVPKVPPDSSLPFEWASIPTESAREDDQQPARFVKIASNEHTVVALDEEGQLFIPPTRLEHEGVKFTDVSCGKEHFMALTEDGDVFTWGCGSRGQLGHGGIDSVDYPRRVDALGGLRMKEICAGGWHSCAVSDCGDLYVWGWNQSGQLALPCRPISTTSTEEEEDYVSVECLPRLLDSVAPFSDEDVVVTSLGCGARHTAATLSDGSGWSWGWNGVGQLGVGGVGGVGGWQPVCVVDKDLRRVICGGWSSIWLRR